MKTDHASIADLVESLRGMAADNWALSGLGEAAEALESFLPFLAWAQEHVDPARWGGHRLTESIKVELMERDAEVKKLRNAVGYAIYLSNEIAVNLAIDLGETRATENEE